MSRRMIEHIRYLWQLLVLTASLLLLGILLIAKTNIDLTFATFLITLLSVFVINLIAFLIMARGVHNQSREGVVYLLGGLGLKFLLYLAYVLIFWGVTKNLSKEFILTFFTLYLFFTFLLAANLFKLLKNK